MAAKKKVSKAKKEKVATVMREFEAGTLTTHGRKVTSRKQAQAIAMSEASLTKKVKRKKKK